MFDAESLINYGGLLLLFLAVYGQTGLFFCFFLPSGGLLFTAGVLIATGSFDHTLFTVCSLLIIAAILGNITGYWFGRKTGPLLSQRKDGGFFRQQHLQAATNFYRKYGAFALAAGLFLPLIRTFAPIVAGMIRRFLLFTTIGAICWIVSFVMGGYLIGSLPFLKPYLKYIVIGIIVLVTIPIVIRIVQEFRKKTSA